MNDLSPASPPNGTEVNSPSLPARQASAGSYFGVFDFIPAGRERDEFYRLPDEAQAQIKLFAPLMAEIDAAPSANAGAKTIAGRINGRIDGCSTQRLRGRYAEWQITGWRACYDHARWGHILREDIELLNDAERTAFRDFIGGYFQQNQRKCKPGYRKFLRYWFAGGDIPGYGTWQKYWEKKGRHDLRVCPRVLPPGWSYDNLIRLAKPPQVELVLARQGTAAALALLPPIPSTRDGLRPLEFVTFDDVDRDWKLQVAGYTQPVRLMQLANRDMAAAKFIRAGCRPQLPNDFDPTKKQRLRISDMKLLVAVTLLDVGYAKNYISHYVLENGTATLFQEDAWALYQVTNGHVVCCYAQMHGGLVLAWDERAKGNSRSKAGHESDHNRLHNEAADRPGQVGKDRDHSPAELTFMEREAVALAKTRNVLAPHEFNRLRMPFPMLDQAIAAAMADLEKLNDRTDHQLEGFQRILQWRLKGELDWRSQAELESWLQQTGKTFDEVCPSLIELNPYPRLETPNERWRRLCLGVEFVKPPFAAIQRLLDDHELCKVKQGHIEFQKDNRKFEYWPEREADALPDYDDLPKQYLGWYVPYAMDYLILTSEDGGYVGTWRRMKLNRLDPEALAAAIKYKTSLLKTAVKNVRRRDALLPDSRMVTRNEALDVNLRVLSDNGFLDHQTIYSAPSPTLGTPAAGVATSLRDGPSANDGAAHRAAATPETSPDRVSPSLASASPDPAPSSPCSPGRLTFATELHRAGARVSQERQAAATADRDRRARTLARAARVAKQLADKYD